MFIVQSDSFGAQGRITIEKGRHERTKLAADTISLRETLLSRAIAGLIRGALSPAAPRGGREECIDDVLHDRSASESPLAGARV